MNERNLTLFQEAYHIAFEVNQHFTKPQSWVALYLSRPEIKVFAPRWEFVSEHKGEFFRIPLDTRQVFCKSLSEEFKCMDTDVVYRLQQKLKITDPLWPLQQLVEQLTSILGVTPYINDPTDKEPGAVFTWYKAELFVQHQDKMEE